MKKALLNIDYTHDFVAADGALTCGEPGQVLHDYILKLTQDFVQEGNFVAFMIDLHDENDPFHPETKLFPPHNLKDSPGRKLYGDLEAYYQEVKDLKHVLYRDKTRYSAFAGTDLAIKLREREITEIHLVGVCTDICILHTAVDAYNQGFEIVVHEQGVASFNQKGHEWALEHFTNCLGATVIN